MAQIDTSSFEKIYDLTYYGNTTKMNNLLNQQDETTLATWQASGTNRCEYNSENRIGAYSGFNIPSGIFIDYIHLYITRYSNQNKTLIVTVQYKDAGGTWHDVQDIDVTTTIPNPSNVETVNIGQTAYGIRWYHYKEPVKSSSNNIFFNGLTLYAPDIPYYTVHFDANGGTGTMTDQKINVDEPTALSSNTFTRDDYSFVGWATSAGGAVVYTDGQIVENLAEENETITLYAKWRVSPMSILLQTNNSELNKVDKEIVTVLTCGGELKSETSIIDPSILIECDLNAVKNVNYMTIPRFGRSYFVNNIRSIRNGLVEFTGHVDVLSSFADELRECTGIISRNSDAYDLYLRDNEIKQLARPRFQQLLFEDGHEPDVDDISYILAVI